MTPAVSLLIGVIAQVTAPVTLTLRLADGHRAFRPGEIIPIELEFDSAVPKRFSVDGAMYDRSGRLTIDEFTIDRMDDVSDPMLDYFGSIGGSIGGGIRGIGVLGEKPFTVRLELNEWFRFDQPGTYTLSVRTRRVSDESITPPAAVPVESNTISFEILPRNAAWESAALDTARRIVDAKPGDARNGCRMMRFLGTDAAAIEMVRRYGADANRGCEFDFMAGLFSAANREAVVRAMEEALRAADRPMTDSYVRTLSVLSVYLRNPGLRPAQTRETKGRMPAGGELSRRPDLTDAAMSAYRDMMPKKIDPAVRLLELPPDRQASLLEYEWQTIAGPAMVPALRRLLDAPPTDSPSVPDLALRRLAQLSPAEARPLILREIRNPRRGATLTTLGILPEAELPDLDDALAANFEARTSEIHAALVQRYATGKIASRILASAGDVIGRMACAQQASVLAYFLRVDEATGTTLLDRAMASRETGCWRSLGTIAALRMTPAIQARAIADLDNPDPDVVIGAIQTLGRHGSAAALEPLRAAFQRWHVTWAGRAAEMTYSRAVERPNARQAMVEDEFRQAIGAGQGWLTSVGELRELQSLCVTDNCRTQTGYMIHEGDPRIMLWTINEPRESHIELAQYRFTSLAALEEMMARYPRGTVFALQQSENANANADVSAAITRLKAFAASRDLSIKER